VAASWQERVAALEHLNAEISARLAMQLDAGSSLDTKAASLLGFILAALAFIFTRPHRVWLVVPTALAFLISFYYFFEALRPRVYQSVPDPETIIGLYDESLATGAANVKEVVLAKTIGTKRLAFEYNVTAVDAPKIRMWHHARIALIAAIVLSVVTLAVGGSGTNDDRRRQHHHAGHTCSTGSRDSRRAGAGAGHDRAGRADAQPANRELPDCGVGRR
jgi:hypothetical protein